MQPNLIDFLIGQRVVPVVIYPVVVYYRHDSTLAQNVPTNCNGNGKTLFRLMPKNVVGQNSLAVAYL